MERNPSKFGGVGEGEGSYAILLLALSCTYSYYVHAALSFHCEQNLHGLLCTFTNNSI